MPREGGRPCGCDPRADHVCDRHAGARDGTDSVIGAGADSVTVTGPSALGDLTLTISDGEGVVHLPRFVVEDLIWELQRRLALRV
jgi:hypothetical protein